MNEKLHYTQIAIITYMIQSGVVLFGLPRIVAEAFGTNGWVGIIPLSCIALVNIWLIILFYKKGEGKSVFSVFEESLPKWATYPIYLFIIALFSLIAVLVAKNYIMLIQLTMFPDVNVNVLLFYFLVVTVFLLGKGIYNIGKVTLLCFYLTIWTTFLILLVIPEFSFTRMTPFFFKEAIDPLGKGLEIYTAFLGYELILFVIPYVQRDGKFAKAYITGHLLTTFIYIAVCFMGMGFYSFQQLIRILYPVQNILKYMETPVVERIENFVFVVFLLKILVTIVFNYWVAIETTKQVLKKVKEKWIIIGIVSVTFAVSFLTTVQREINTWVNFLVIPEIIFSFGFPIILLLLLWLKKAKAKGGNQVA